MFDNTYFRELKHFYMPSEPEKQAAPKLAYLNVALLKELGIPLPSDALTQAELLCGNRLFEGAEPIAQAYAGHQFGHFNPQLGDGRALILGEIVTPKIGRLDLALKGSGRTPFSRNGDGKAALGPMLREVLISEAMYALGVPTTRSLGVVQTAGHVYRERTLTGAVLSRLAASHIRIGTFQYFAARREYKRVDQLAKYCIARHYPELTQKSDPYLALLKAVVKRQAELVAKWMSFGFIHGVMNTDNISIAGETIDYGPCAFMESYDLATVFSSIDHAGRYAYGNQPSIMQWNLARFAETLLPLIAEQLKGNAQLAQEGATKAVQNFIPEYEQAWLRQAAYKLGIKEVVRVQSLLPKWLDLLSRDKVDFTLAWRYLCDAAIGHENELAALFTSKQALTDWLMEWRSCLQEENLREEALKRTVLNMKKHNPLIIPRNHAVEYALEMAESESLEAFYDLLSAVQKPYDEAKNHMRYTVPASSSFTSSYQTFCGT